MYLIAACYLTEETPLFTIYMKSWIKKEQLCAFCYSSLQNPDIALCIVFSNNYSQLRHFLAWWTYCRLTSTFQVMFICNHRPFVKHLKKDIAKLTSFYMEVRTWKNWQNVLLFFLYLWLTLDTMQKGLGVVAISSNSIRMHPQVRSYYRYNNNNNNNNIAFFPKQVGVG